MNQRLLNYFDVVLNEKYFGFCFIPGTVNFDDVYGALDHFKSEVDKLKVLEEERMKKLQDEAAAKEDEAGSEEVASELVA